MKGTSFWNRIGLPCVTDIQKLQAAACSQAEALSSLISLNNEVIRMLGEAKSEVSSSINSANSSQHEAVKIAVEKIVDAMQKYHGTTSQMLVQQADKLAANSGILTALQTDAEELHIAAQKQKDAAASIIQLDKDIIKLLEDAKAAIANSISEEGMAVRTTLDAKEAHLCLSMETERNLALQELGLRINQEGTESRKAVETGVEKLESVISDGKSDILQQLTQQMGRTTELMKVLTAFRSETSYRDETEHEQIQQLFKESTMQSELLRILVANSMIEDVSQLLK